MRRKRSGKGGTGTTIVTSALAAGRRSGVRMKQERTPITLSAANTGWAAWYRMRKRKAGSWRQYHAAARAYLRGLFRSAGGQGGKKPPAWVLLPTRKRCAAVVTAMNEGNTLPLVLKELRRLALAEVILVVNGSSDHSFEAARAHPDAIVIHYAKPLGHDVGRAIGAKLTKADAVLFVDGDMAIKAEQLVPFLASAAEGEADLALNRISPLLPPFHRRDYVSHVKQFLNQALGLSRLGAASMTAVPHALSRRAIETIGAPNLVVPPKAQAIAAMKGLTVKAPATVDVIRSNRIRRHNTGMLSPVAELIIGDHLEALQTALGEQGPRLQYEDRIRKRDMLKKEVDWIDSIHRHTHV